ncbi:nuclear transport factor 2 family protein [Kibdelosporangium aridum]|uniref:nuclear transport factor 2 family protein n=1 Tax=Kibdelosporangium aridum TaxID=2030 RepID=UPI0035E91619
MAAEMLERVRMLEDKEEIRNLTQAYQQTLDDRDLRAFSKLFATGGTWTDGSNTATGPSAIYAMLNEMLPENPPAPGATTWHFTNDPAIQVDGDRAIAFTLLMLVSRGEGNAPLLSIFGSYQDKLIRENGRWRFLLRIATHLIPT